MGLSRTSSLLGYENFVETYLKTAHNLVENHFKYIFYFISFFFIFTILWYLGLRNGWMKFDWSQKPIMFTHTQKWTSGIYRKF